MLTQAAQTVEAGSVYDAMVSFFTADGWKFRAVDGRPFLVMDVSAENGQWRCLAQAKDEMQQFFFYSILSLSVPEDRRAAASEYLTRANSGLSLGNFELDFSDGEIRYKTSTDVTGGHLEPDMIRRQVMANLATVDHYYPGLMQVVYGNEEPARAIEAVESNG